MGNFHPFSYTLDTIVCAIENPGKFLRGSPDFENRDIYVPLLDSNTKGFNAKRC